MVPCAVLIESVLSLFVVATKPKETSAHEPFSWFFDLFSLGTNFNASESMEGTIYVWQVFGEDNLVPGAFSFENGRGGRHPTHFLREESWGQSCKEKERHANT